LAVDDSSKRFQQVLRLIGAVVLPVMGVVLPRGRRPIVAFLIAGLLLAGCGGNTRPPVPPLVQPEDRAPSWSPDGGRIAFVHFNPDFADTAQPSGVYVSDLAGVIQQVVITPHARSVDWSPDGRWLVFNDATGLHVVQSSGDSLSTIYSGGSFPSWSPDGTEIAFSTSLSVWGIAPDGTALRRITPVDSIAGDPDWSPDGRRLVVLGNPGSIGEEVLIFSTVDQTFSRLTTDSHEDRSPSWSPLGDQIAWNPWPIDSRNRTRPQIWVMDTLGVNRRFLASAESAPAWEPTGSRLVFSRQADTGLRLFLINADGTGLRQLTH
jgi:Tol biopolymer transport system component